MYVTPRPDVEEDPHYALRLGATGLFAYLAVVILSPQLPVIVAALPIGLIAAQRKAFNPTIAIAGPITMIILAAIMAWFVELLRPMPLVYISAMWLTFFLGFYMILKSGAQTGMLIIILAVLMSVMGMNGSATLEVMRDGLIEASLVALVITPLLFTLFPPSTTEKHLDNPAPTEGNIVLAATIRASVLMLLCFWLYLIIQPSNMMMAVIAVMVLVFPSRKAVFDEAGQRIRATFYGSGVALLILAIFTLSPHLPVLLGLIFLSGLWLGNGMLFGKHPSMVYQYAYSVALALVVGALTAQDSDGVIFTRIVLTLAGAFIAVFSVAYLDHLTSWIDDKPALVQQ